MTRVVVTEAAYVSVGIGGRFEDTRTVRLDVEQPCELTPDESRRIAVILIEYAAQAERRGGGRR